MENQIPCKITKDLTGSHVIKITVDGQTFPLVVDDYFISKDSESPNGDGYLKVFVISSLTKQALVEIPSQSLGSSRIWIPKEMLNGQTR